MGLRVIVTTHSHWILEKFANLVGVSRLSVADREEMEAFRPQLAGASLNPDEVGVWYVSPGKSSHGSAVSEIVFDEETADYAMEFPDVGEDLSGEWESISDMLRERAVQ